MNIYLPLQMQDVLVHQQCHPPGYPHSPSRMDQSEYSLCLSVFLSLSSVSLTIVSILKVEFCWVFTKLGIQLVFSLLTSIYNMQTQSMCTFYVMYKYKVYEISCKFCDTINMLINTCSTVIDIYPSLYQLGYSFSQLCLLYNTCTYSRVTN